jgi:hypothetical protein
MPATEEDELSEEVPVSFLQAARLNSINSWIMVRIIFFANVSATHPHR